jgi:NAD(P)-dependent dehydrogenase (short-subunit alcohol dehydrogenase family)
MASDQNKQTAAEHTWQGEGFAGLLRGKVAVVTGAARGIGRAIAVDLAKNGASVVAVDIAETVSKITEFEPATKADLEETGKLLEAIGGKWSAKVADIRKIGELKALVEEVEREFGGVDIVVANAGIQAFKSLLEMEDADWHDIIDNNLNGTANTVRAFAPALVRRGGGKADPGVVDAGALWDEEWVGVFGVEVGDYRADEVGCARVGQAQDHGEHD